MDTEAYALILRRLAALERRLSAVFRIGKVHAVRRPKLPYAVRTDPYAVQVDLGPGDDGESVLTDFLPVMRPRAGETGEWTPLTRGERVAVFAPGGEDASAFVQPGIASDDYMEVDDDIQSEVRRFAAEDDVTVEVARIEVFRGATPAESHMLLRCGRSLLRLNGDGTAVFGVDRLDYQDPP